MKSYHIKPAAIIAAFTVLASIPLWTAICFAQEKGEKEEKEGKRTAPVAGKITPWAAMKIAEGKVKGGKALNADFEFDEGHWVYGVFVVSGKTLQEVEIDPMTGKVGDVEKIDPVSEGKEVTSELQKAMKG